MPRSPSRGKRNRPTKAEFLQRLNGRTEEEVIAALMRHFCEGSSASDARRAVNAELGTDLRREDPLRFLRQAASQGRLCYIAPQEARWGQAIQEAYELKSARVIRTSQACDVAHYGAKLLLSLIEKRTRQKSGSSRCADGGEDRQDPGAASIRIGFGGGQTLFSLASRLTQMLIDLPHHDLPANLSMHAMVGSTWDATVTTPNYFFGKFIDAVGLDLDIRFVNLPAPPIVTNQTYRALVKEPVVREAIAFKDELDIVCTSAGNWADPHAAFPQLLERWLPRRHDLIKQLDGVGDMLWLPLVDANARGPRQAQRRQYRPMTLLSDLNELRGLIDRGLDCLVVLSSCRRCGKAKTEVLRSLLTSRLVTHLVVDTKTAEPLVEELDH